MATKYLHSCVDATLHGLRECAQMSSESPPDSQGKTASSTEKYNMRPDPQANAMDLGLVGKRAIVTGGSKGMGNAIANRLAAEGADVAIGARSEGPLTEAADEIEAEHGTRCVPITVDLTSVNETETFVEEAVSGLDGLDILVNNAGKAVAGSLPELTEEDWDTTIDLKMQGLVRCTQKAMPYLTDGDGGVIVNNIGNDGSKPSATELSPGAICAANINFTEALAKEYGRKGVRINAVNPGPVETGLWSNFLDGVAERLDITREEADRVVKNSVPLGRTSEPENIADVVAFLASERAMMVNGAVIDVDGGQEKSLLELDSMRNLADIIGS